MGDCMGEALLVEVGLQFVDIAAECLDFGMLPPGEPPDEQFHAGTVFGEGGGDLLREEDARAPLQPEASFQGVMVCEGEVRKSAIPQLLVKRLGIGVALGEVSLSQDPSIRGAVESGMEMQVNASHGTLQFTAEQRQGCDAWVTKGKRAASPISGQDRWRGRDWAREGSGAVLMARWIAKWAG
ncbi:MAG: hypothetical protein RLZZ399_801 [Verrucomicrobiota bacterium]|jgi:hypothetical protein